jgi:syntaxin 1B/2/3
MVEMSALVSATGERIDNIEQDIGKAKDHVVGATEKLDQAKQHHKSYRKKMCCFILIGFIIIVAILAPILITQIK